MSVHLRKYLWITTPLVVGICSYFAARAVGQVVAGSLPNPRPRPIQMASRTPLGSAIHRSPDLSDLLSRNVFCSTCEPETAPDPGGEGSGEGGEPGSDEPTKSSLNLKLVATLVGDPGTDWSFAALHDPTDLRTRLYRVGMEVPGGATVVDVMQRRVMLQQGNRLEYIDLEQGESASSSNPVAAPPSHTPRRRPPPLAKELEGSVRKLGPNKWEIQRSALNKVLTNTHLLARSARIVPSMRNGKPNGFKLYAIRPGSIYSLIGMQNGDTINAVNGRPMTTPDKALEVYTKVRNASHLSISFTRRGQTKTHDYVIR